MNESQLYEKIGRLQAALDQLNQNYDQLLVALAKVVSGEIDVGRVLVNLTDRSYLWTDPNMRPPMPAILNGSPKVITAADPVELTGFRDDTGEVTIQGRNLVVIRIEKPTV